MTRAGTDLFEASADDSRTVDSYLRAFSPAPPWDELPSWPPDVFAVANLILDHTQGYRFVVAPPAGGRWPPSPDWNAHMRDAALQWRASGDDPHARLPELVDRCWRVLTGARDLSLAKIRTGEAWPVCEALLTLHAIADECCGWLAGPIRREPCTTCEALAWKLLDASGSLSRVCPARIRVVPKGRFTTRGITIRSLSRYLALCYEAVDLRWKRVGPDAAIGAAMGGRSDYNVLLIPWPLSVRASDFHAVPTPLGNMDEDVFGFFEFAPASSPDLGYIRSILADATAGAKRVDFVVLPEAAIEPDDIPLVEEALVEHGSTFLIAGVRTKGEGTSFGRNYLHVGVHTANGWVRFEQDKHHRWCLDGNQIHQYHLARSLNPNKLWWEAVDIRPRALNVIDFGGGATTAPLVCEDLARMDEVADLLRRIGPSVVIAVLLDGPQLSSRWPCRYASVLSDEPGSAVLTLTSYGMVARSRPDGVPGSRVVALWSSSSGALREIELARGADAVAITLSVSTRSVWTADGRCHGDVPFITLSGERQLHARRRPPRRYAGEMISTSFPSGSST